MTVQGSGRSALPSEESVALLASARRGRLITTLGALPAAEPVPFVADGRQVVVRVAEPDPIHTGDIVSLQVDDVDERTGAGWSVLVTGSARRIGSDDRLVERLCARATEDWLNGVGELVLLAEPLIRGILISRTPPVPRGGPPVGGKPPEAMRVAVSLAARAPSVHNTQPWRWEATETELDLYAEPERRLPVVDPNGRELLISCGAALQHARTALVAAGWGVQTSHFPDPDDPDHLARLRLLGRVLPEDRDLRLANAATRRRTDRRPFRAQPVSEDRLAELTAAAGFEDAMLYVVQDREGWLRVSALVDHAARVQGADAAYRTELARWVGPGAPEGLGVPLESVTAASGPRTPAIRDFAITAAGRLHSGETAEHPTLAVLCTRGDDRRDWLRAGEATARVLLVAEVEGLAVSPLTAPLEVPSTRALLAEMLRERLPDAGQPQLLLRIGLPAAGERPPLTPRISG
ncbi:MAG TPA: pyridoxamine 5'-phosphate oxidase family protein [Mycobacteriales bacterium]